MSQFKKGAAALGALQQQGGGEGFIDSEFAKFGVGKTYKVRILGTTDLMQYVGYGIYKKVNTFVAKNPSIRDEKGNAIENLTPWDKAEKYHRDLQFAASDAKNEAESKKQGQEASKYRGKERYAFGFIDLETGKEIVIDLSRDQALGIYPTITKYENKLGKLAFELSKTNATGQAKDTKVSLTPIIDFDEDLSDKERANFAKFDGKEFNQKLFDGLLFEADEKQQIENLVAAGFDITLIGLSIGTNSQADEEGTPIEDEPTADF